MRLSQEVIADLAVLLRRTSVSLGCEEASVSVGSYYRWHWESRKFSRRRVPNAVDTPYVGNRACRLGAFSICEKTTRRTENERHCK